jgi:aquaporin Z
MPGGASDCSDCGKEKLLRERLLAEFVGVFFLAFTIGVAVAGGSPLAPFAIGLILGIQIFQFGSVSGGQFNPAVTLAVFLAGRRKLSPAITAAYIGTQMLAAFIGALLAYAITERTFCFHYDFFATSDPSGSTRFGFWGTSAIIEIIFTTVLASSVLHAGTSFDAPNHYFGFVIGGTVLAGALASGGFDQGSFNPAVTFGFNIVNFFSDINRQRSGRLFAGVGPVDTRFPDGLSWVLFLLCPFIGSVFAALIFRATRGEEYPGGQWDLSDIFMRPTVSAAKAPLVSATMDKGMMQKDMMGIPNVAMNVAMDVGMDKADGAMMDDGGASGTAKKMDEGRTMMDDGRASGTAKMMDEGRTKTPIKLNTKPEARE